MLEKSAAAMLVSNEVCDDVIATAIILTTNSSGLPTTKPAVKVSRSSISVGDGLTPAWTW